MSFLGGLGKGLSRAFDGTNLAITQAILAGDYQGAAALRARQGELQRQLQQDSEQHDARDRQVIGAKNLDFTGDEISGMSGPELSAAIRQRALARMFGGDAGQGEGEGGGQAQPADGAGPPASLPGQAAPQPSGMSPPRINYLPARLGPLPPGLGSGGAMARLPNAAIDPLQGPTSAYGPGYFAGDADLGAAKFQSRFPGDGGAPVIDRNTAIQQAAAAIQGGADPNAVRARLIQMGHGDQGPPSPFSDLIPKGGAGMMGDSAPQPVQAQPAFDDQGGLEPRAVTPRYAQVGFGQSPNRLDPRLAPQKAGEFRKGGASDAGQTTLFTNGSPPLLGDGQARRGSPTADPAGGPNRGLNWLASAVGRRIPPPAPWREGGRWNRQTVDQRAARAVRMYKLDVARGRRPDEAAGWAAASEAESGGDYRFHQPHGPGVGLYQWSSNGPRDTAFQHLFGHPIDQSTEDEQLRFRDWELAHSEARAAAMIARAGTAGDVGDAITRYFERPKRKDRDAADRANVAEAIRRLMAQSHIAPERAGQQTQSILGSGSGPAR